MNKLASYLREEGLSNKDFAKSIEVSASYLSEILRDDFLKEPSLEVAKRITSETKGAVGLCSWPKFQSVIDAFHEQNSKFANYDLKHSETQNG